MDTFVFQTTTYLNVYLPSRATLAAKMGNVYAEYGESWSEVGHNSVVFIHVIVSRYSSEAIRVRPESSDTPLVDNNGNAIDGFDMGKGDCATFAYFNSNWYIFNRMYT